MKGTICLFKLKGFITHYLDNTIASDIDRFYSIVVKVIDMFNFFSSKANSIYRKYFTIIKMHTSIFY